jgi:hypothetical protein
VTSCSTRSGHEHVVSHQLVDLRTAQHALEQRLPVNRSASLDGLEELGSCPAVINAYGRMRRCFRSATATATRFVKLVERPRGHDQRAVELVVHELRATPQTPSQSTGGAPPLTSGELDGAGLGSSCQPPGAMVSNGDWRVSWRRFAGWRVQVTRR